jgi:hypothetical protein
MLKRNPKVEEAPLQNDLMLFHPDSSQFYVLNPTMAFIWRRCESLQSVETLIEDLTEAFEGVDRAVAAEDVRNACQELISRGLVIDTASAIT